MARFRRRRFRSSRRSGRKVRWNGLTWQVDTILDANPNDFSWLSWWVKWPASLVNVDATPPANQVAYNEPVDDTLVRFFNHYDATVLIPGTAGVAPITSLALGVIPFSGGDFPEFFDFSVFSSSSLVAPQHPVVQLDDPWIYRSVFSNGSLEELQFSSDQYEKNEWVKSMRKLPANTGLLAVLGCIAIGASASVPVTLKMGGESRFLVKSGYAL